jgi:HAD superfamily hydrolase (TIGR01662 family)
MAPQLERRRLLAAPCPSPTPALFLDRDGVVIEDRHHLCDPAAVELCPGAQALLQQANQAGWPVVLVTNQSGIARGYFDWKAYEQVTDRLLELLGAEAPVASIYANGHGPGAPPHSWRKPRGQPQATVIYEHLKRIFERPEKTKIHLGIRPCTRRARSAAPAMRAKVRIGFNCLATDPRPSKIYFH